MGDDMDLCECVWSHEYAMARLLALIRQGQSQCSDTECVDVSGRLTQHQPAADEANSFTMMTLFMTLAFMFMYFVRPDSILKFTSSKRRQRRNDDSNTPPPPPPPPAPPAVN